ncbi:hypothetical protein GOP47_0010681 [Adiantum capillus-veneris]|uniref:Aluminum-activated malate transporter n=1 Tax=Adiantum capillus-veneris TaxID=13818 RepID=A0A9D4UVR5_ADICA|nr:hypothetical protein GOP47_0010681 [Adiantum capillus-veneris]
MGTITQIEPVINCNDTQLAPLLEHYIDGSNHDGRRKFAIFRRIGRMGKLTMSQVAVAASLLRSRALDVVLKDTMKTIHALKMGFALVLAFLLVLVHASYAQLGSHAVWAIMTVIVVFEYTIGATLSKGLNRGVGTLLAGLLAIVASELAEKSGSGVGHPILVGFIVFTIGGVVTFAKLWPSLKSYEFGFRSFLLTFSLIMVAEYREGDPLGTAINRFWVILLGAFIGVSVNVFVLPCWAGNELHHSLVTNFFSVADSLEVCVNEYLQGSVLERFPSKVFMEKIVEDPFYKRYRPTLMSASKEESLAGFASWEPPHGRFKVVKYPWHLYVKVGAVLRHCTYSVVALHGCLQSGIQAPLKVRKLFHEEIRAVGVECACLLRELGKQIEDMQKGNPATLLKGVEHAIERLQESLYYCSYLLVRDEEGCLEDAKGNVAVSVIPEVTMLRNVHSMGSQLRSIDNLELSCGHEKCSNDWEESQCLKRTYTWPLRPRDQLDYAREPLLGQRVRIVKSASALSVGTFATLLMEVALRLDYVAEAVQELGECAGFTDFKKDVSDSDLKIQWCVRNITSDMSGFSGEEQFFKGSGLQWHQKLCLASLEKKCMSFQVPLWHASLLYTDKRVAD